MKNTQQLSSHQYPQYFLFPPNSLKDQTIINLKHLKDIITNMDGAQPYYTKFKFISSLYPRQEVQMLCEQCNAQILYKIGEKKLKLVSFKNEHFHPRLKKKVDNKEEQEKKQEDVMDQEISNKFKNPSLKFINQSSKNKDTNYIKNIIKDLSTREYMVSSIYSEENQEQPYLVLVISQQMKQNYARFGDVVCFSIINHLLKDKFYNNVGLFSGIDTGVRLTIFGFCFIMNKESDKVYEQLFRSFFQKMQKSPQSFFTDERAGIRYGLQKIQEEGIYPGLHLYDSFQILSKIKKKVSDPEKLKLYKKCIEAQTLEDFNSHLEILRKQTNQQEADSLNTFLKKSKLFCFSKIPEVFVGLSISQSITKKVSELVKCHIPQGTLREVLKSIQSQQKSSKPQFHNKNIQQFFHSPILKFYRENLEEKIYKIAAFLYLQKANFAILSDEPDQNCLVVTESKSSLSYNPNKQHSQYVIREEMDKKFVCSCGITTKIGIPCPHLIKVLQYKKISIQSYLNPRWIVMVEDSEKIREANEARKNGDLISIGTSEDSFHDYKQLDENLKIPGIIPIKQIINNGTQLQSKPQLGALNIIEKTISSIEPQTQNFPSCLPPRQKGQMDIQQCRQKNLKNLTQEQIELGFYYQQPRERNIQQSNIITQVVVEQVCELEKYCTIKEEKPLQVGGEQNLNAVRQEMQESLDLNPNYQMDQQINATMKEQKIPNQEAQNMNNTKSLQAKQDNIQVLKQNKATEQDEFTIRRLD